MTVAVCIQCGRVKVGAFTRCLSCRFTPAKPEDLAKSILLSDQVSKCGALDKASDQLQSGGVVEFDSQAVAEWTAAAQVDPQDVQMPLGCAIIWYVPLVVMVLLMLVLVVLLLLMAGRT